MAETPLVQLSLTSHFVVVFINLENIVDNEVKMYCLRNSHVKIGSV